MATLAWCDRAQKAHSEHGPHGVESRAVPFSAPAEGPSTGTDVWSNVMNLSLISVVSVVSISVARCYGIFELYVISGEGMEPSAT
jgi:hypothetical protein